MLSPGMRASRVVKRQAIGTPDRHRKRTPHRRWGRLVPVANRRVPRASRSAFTSDGAARVGGTCLPTGANSQTGVIENGFVYIPETAPWLAEYLHEMTVFPKGKHDDQVDSTAQFLDWFKKPMAGWGIYEFYRQQAEALAAAARGEELKPLKDQPLDLVEVY